MRRDGAGRSPEGRSHHERRRRRHQRRRAACRSSGGRWRSTRGKSSPWARRPSWPRPTQRRRSCREHGMALMPGLVNGHSHVPMVLFRGLADDLTLEDWLTHYIFPAEARFVDEEFVRIGEALGCWEMIRGGTTTFLDMYYQPDVAAKVVGDCRIARGDCAGRARFSQSRRQWLERRLRRGGRVSSSVGRGGIHGSSPLSLPTAPTRYRRIICARRSPRHGGSTRRSRRTWRRPPGRWRRSATATAPARYSTSKIWASSSRASSPPTSSGRMTMRSPCSRGGAWASSIIQPRT